MADKLILPCELRVCATSSFWDGARRVNADARLVVAAETCAGECMLRAQDTPCTLTGRRLSFCNWEPLPEADGPIEAQQPLERNPPAGAPAGAQAP
jgi:hypothetical protein